jgi:ubiquitin-protein ligase E3 A
VFSDSKSLNKSFLLETPKQIEGGGSLFVDVDAVRRVYKALFEIGDTSVENALLNSLATLSSGVELDVNYQKLALKDPNYLNQFIVVMENTMLQSPEYLDQALPSFLKSLCLLPIKYQAQLVRIWCSFDVEDIRRMLQTLQQLITYQVLTGPSAVNHIPVHEDDAIVNSTKVMKLLYVVSIIEGDKGNPSQICLPGTNSSGPVTANSSFYQDQLFKELRLQSLDCHQPFLNYEEFVNEPLNEHIEVDRDYTYFRSEQQKFSFLNHSFLLSTSTKGLGLFYDNRVRMYSERRLTMLYSLVHGQQHSTPYLRLKVRRDSLIDDALVRVSLYFIFEFKPRDNCYYTCKAPMVLANERFYIL